MEFKIKFDSVYKPVKVYQTKELACVDKNELKEALYGFDPKVGECHYNAIRTTTLHSIWGTPIEYVEGLAKSKRRTYHQGMTHCWNKTTDNNGNTIYFDVTPLDCEYDYVVLREFTNYHLYNFQNMYIRPTISLFVIRIGKYWEYYTNDGVMHRTTRLLDANTIMDNELPVELRGLCWEYSDLDGKPRKRRPTDHFNIF